jgi:hypothetical protein
MRRLLAGEGNEYGEAVVGMAGMLLSSCYVTLDEKAEASRLLTFLLNIEPDNPLLFAARGKLNYPNLAESIHDLAHSIKLGLPMNWPFVWIATYQMEKSDYSAVKETCLAAFKRPLVPRIHSELLELFAIAEASSGAPVDEVREIFKRAISVDIRNTRAVDNMNRFEELVRHPNKLVGWRQESTLIVQFPDAEEERDFTESLQRELAIAA